MFGYIKPSVPDLRVKEYELYRAVYCGLCTSLGKKVTCTSRLSLSYDFVFLAVVRMALTGETGKIVKKRCVAHLTKKRSVMVDSPQLDITARLSALLSYYKIRDDIADLSGIKRLGAMLLLPAASHMKRRAGIDDECESFVKNRLSALCALENNRCNSLDMVSEPFGELMAEICAYGFEKESRQARIASEIGRHIGRFVYIIDAVDDLYSDIKSGAYNPLAVIYDNDISKLNSDIELLKNSLILTLHSVSDAVELIDFGDYHELGEIIKNTIYIGLPNYIEAVISKYKDNNTQTEKK